MYSVKLITPFSVLLVEDEKMLREIISRLVVAKFPQCTIYTAEHGEEGVKLFIEHSPDIVVTDINMPKMDGIEMARKIKAINSNAKLIVLSAHNDYVEQFEEIGYCAYLPKPFDFDVLTNAIQYCLPLYSNNEKINRWGR